MPGRSELASIMARWFAPPPARPINGPALDYVMPATRAPRALPEARPARTAVAAIGCAQVSSVRAEHPTACRPKAPGDPMLGMLRG
jgi:hypothetical protein